VTVAGPETLPPGSRDREVQIDRLGPAGEVRPCRRQDHHDGAPFAGPGRQPSGIRRADPAERGEQEQVDAVEQGGGHHRPLLPGRGHEGKPVERRSHLGRSHQAERGETDGGDPCAPPGDRHRERQRQGGGAHARIGRHADDAPAPQAAIGEQLGERVGDGEETLRRRRHGTTYGRRQGQDHPGIRGRRNQCAAHTRSISNICSICE
jgi:hypothetical protein